MVKNRHSKDRLFITATEWANEYGGKKDVKAAQSHPLSFDQCGLSLTAFRTPVCLREGVIFDLEALMEHLIHYKTNPVTGEPASAKDMIRLNMTKNSENQWCCPITNKVFTNSSHIVAIRTSGNVYSYDAVSELNIKPKNYTDLMTGESFVKSDIITLQNPQDAEHSAIRDIKNFAHLKRLKEESQSVRDSVPKIRTNATTESVLKAIEVEKAERAASGENKKNIEDYVHELNNPKEYIDDVQAILDLKPTTQDVNPGQVNTDGRASSSLTSSVMTTSTSDSTRMALPEEIRDAKWKIMRKLGKKGYVQLQTSLGNLNLEIHCDISPKTSYNFLTLCERGYYDNVVFHRLIPGFMVQTGDPSGTGSGGQSAWNKPFRDEFDTRVLHNSRGILSMANSGVNTNGSQFFITFAECKHLDLKHAVFGRLVGGNATLDRIESIETDKKDKPKSEIKIISTIVMSNPCHEADAILMEEVKGNMQTRLKHRAVSALPSKPLIMNNNTNNNTNNNKRNRNDLNESDNNNDNNNESNRLTVKANTNSDAMKAFLEAQNASLNSSLTMENASKKKRNDLQFAQFSSW